MLHSLMHCPPTFGIMGTEREVVELALKETHGKVDERIVTRTVNRYFKSGTMPKLFMKWMNETFSGAGS